MESILQAPSGFSTKPHISLTVACETAHCHECVYCDHVWSTSHTVNNVSEYCPDSGCGRLLASMESCKLEYVLPLTDHKCDDCGGECMTDDYCLECTL